MTANGVARCRGRLCNRSAQKKHNKPQLLPATKDLQSLRMFLRDGIQTLTKEVRENPMRENWRKLAVLALARLMIFNKRRSMLYLINSL